MLAVLIASLLLGAGEPANPLFKELVEKDLPLPAGQTVRLPPPLMTNRLPPREQQAVLQKAAGTLPLDLFIKKTDAAPFSIKINSVDNAAGTRVAQTLDVFFVAHGMLDRVIKEDVLNALIGTNAKKGKDTGEVKLLNAAALRQRGIHPLEGPGLEERYAHLDVFLLERVKITGVTRNVKTRGPGWALLAMQIDGRFENDKEYPNRWSSFNAQDEVFGPPQVYSGLGGYVRVTDLTQPEGALFFELHALIREPEAWFGGPNLLRSKLPLLIQENVRNLRRKLGRE